MRLAGNVFVHDPVVKLGRVEPDRLRAHGWSEDAVRQQVERNTVIRHELSVSLPDEPSALPSVDLSGSD